MIDTQPCAAGPDEYRRRSDSTELHVDTVAGAVDAVLAAWNGSPCRRCGRTWADHERVKAVHCAEFLY